MQGSLLSNLGDGTPTGKGIPTIATYNAMGYMPLRPLATMSLTGAR